MDWTHGNFAQLSVDDQTANQAVGTALEVVETWNTELQPRGEDQTADATDNNISIDREAGFYLLRCWMKVQMKTDAGGDGETLTVEFAQYDATSGWQTIDSMAIDYAFSADEAIQFIWIERIARLKQNDLVAVRVVSDDDGEEYRFLDGGFNCERIG